VKFEISIMPRVVAVDTNVWVSAFLAPRGHPAQLKFFWQANHFDVVVSVQCRDPDDALSWETRESKEKGN
jgi:hypothetical protein